MTPDDLLLRAGRCGPCYTPRHRFLDCRRREGLRLNEGHLSIGIDVGTTTFHYVVNRIFLEKQPAKGGFPRFSLAGFEPIYQSPVFLTPYRAADDELDREPIIERMEKDLAAAGFLPADMETGSVIVTGNAAKRKNAEGIISSLALLFPQMVSTIAGSKLESLLAARGARVDRYSRIALKKVMNIDIGGGTTNLALFQNGRTLGLASLWLGGRMIRLDQKGRILRMTPAARRIAAEEGLKLSEGFGSRADLQCFADAVARRLFDFVAGKKLPPELIDFDELPLEVGNLDAVCFTGGVAEIMRCPPDTQTDWLRFEDLGVLLAERLRDRARALKLIEPGIARIRATAVGVGVHHVQIAGSTVYLSDSSLLPLTNIPVVKLSLDEWKADEYARKLAEAAGYFTPGTQLAYYVEAGKDIGYAHLSRLAEALLDHLQHSSSRLLIAAFDRDLGKAFGYIAASFCREKLEVGIVSIDDVILGDNTTLDIGRALAEGAIPVCAKTLYF